MYGRTWRLACRALQLRGVTAWINGEPRRIEQMHGKVVVVHFYTYARANRLWPSVYLRDKQGILPTREPHRPTGP